MLQQSQRKRLEWIIELVRLRKVCCFLIIIYQVLELIFAAIQGMMLVPIEVLHLHVKSKFNLHLAIVIWDSHPLALGATPRQVYIDGIPQLENSKNWINHPNSKLSQKHQTGIKKETEETDGIPPLLVTGKHGGTEGKIIQIIGVKSVWHYGSGGRIEPLFDDKNGEGRSVFLQDGLLVCVDDVDLVCSGGFVEGGS